MELNVRLLLLLPPSTHPSSPLFTDDYGLSEGTHAQPWPGSVRVPAHVLGKAAHALRARSSGCVSQLTAGRTRTVSSQNMCFIFRSVNNYFVQVKTFCSLWGGGGSSKA